MRTFIATLVLSFAAVTLFTGCSSETSTPDESDVSTNAPATPDTPDTPDTPAAPEQP